MSYRVNCLKKKKRKEKRETKNLTNEIKEKKILGVPRPLPMSSLGVVEPSPNGQMGVAQATPPKLENHPIWSFEGDHPMGCGGGFSFLVRPN